MRKPAKATAKRSTFFELVPLDAIRKVIEADGSTSPAQPRGLPTAMSKCFVTRCQSTLCHIEIAHTHGLTKATPWAQDRQGLRPVLNTGRHQPEFLAHDEGAALVAVIAFLEERFGSTAELPLPCSAQEHAKTGAVPLAWTEKVASAERQ